LGFIFGYGNCSFGNAMTFYCVQCKAEREVETFEEFRTKHNLRMAKATCPVCGFPLYRKLDTQPEQEKKA